MGAAAALETTAQSSSLRCAAVGAAAVATVEGVVVVGEGAARVEGRD